MKNSFKIGWLTGIMGIFTLLVGCSGGGGVILDNSQAMPEPREIIGYPSDRVMID